VCGRADDDICCGWGAARWRGDGEELFFVAADGKVMAVPVKASAGAKPAFEAGATVASV